MLKIIYYGDWHGQVAQRLFDHLKSKNIDVELSCESNFKSGDKTFETRKVIYIEDDSAGGYYVLDFKDMLGYKNNFVVREVVHDDRCFKILKSQYRKDHYIDPPYNKIIPFTYFEKNPELVQSLRLKDGPSKSIKKMFFRGQPWKNRNKVLDRIDDIIIPNRLTSIEDYYNDMRSHWIGLALPGWGNICHRELEYFAFDIAVIMPKLKNTFHNDLIPDYHYISVDVNTTKDKSKVIASGIRDAYESVVDDRDKLNEVISNARRWYEENVMFPNSIKLITTLLGII
ncbi:MAG: hypothetical protein GF411_14410 [Candidatus Lokiarchaeota archaeon]|nr:hypothetical protein [Candidatus Lokiarchaeota archaeon]